MLDTLIGRDAEREEILNALNNRDLRALILYGPQSSGKTLLLKTLASEWLSQSEFQTVYCDLKNTSDTSPSELLAEITKLTVGTLEVAGVENRAAATREAELDRWHSFLSALSPHNRLILILDSFETVFDPPFEFRRSDGGILELDISSPEPEDADEDSASVVDNCALDPFFHDFLQQLIAAENVILVLATNSLNLQPLVNLFHAQAAHVHTLCLPFLTRNEINRLIHTEDFEGLISWSDSAAVEHVWRLSGGHPYVAKMICAAVSDEIFRDIGEITSAIVVEPAMIETAILDAKERLEPMFSEWWTGLSLGEQIILTTIASVHPNTVPEEHLELILNDVRLSQVVFSESPNETDSPSWLEASSHEILVKLLSTNILIEVENTYRFSIDLYRRWILEHTELSAAHDHLVKQTATEVMGGSSRTSRTTGVRSILAPSSRKLIATLLILTLVGALFLLPRDSLLVFIQQASARLPEIAVSERLEAVPWLDRTTGAEQLDRTAGPEVFEDGGGDNAILVENVQQVVKPPSIPNAPAEASENGEHTASDEVKTSGDERSEDVSTAPAAVARSESEESVPAHVREVLFTGSQVWSVDIDSEGRNLAAGLENGTIRVWDLSNIEESRAAPLELSGHEDAVYSVAFDPDESNRLASGSADDSVRLWDVTTAESSATLREHTDDVLTVAFSPDGEVLASGSADGSIKLWHAQLGKLQHTLVKEQDWILSMAYSMDGTRFAVGSASGAVQIWDPKIRVIMQTLEAHTDWVSSVEFAPSGHLFASGAYDHQTLIWQIIERRSSKLSDGDSLETMGSVNGLVFHPSGEYLIVGHGSGMVAIWDLNNFERLVTLSEHEDDVRSVSIAPEGDLVATGSLDGTVRLWQLNLE